MVTSIKEFPKPFAIMKVGIKGYETEKRFWKTTETTVGHIIVRVAEELLKTKSLGVMNFRPFVLTAGLERSIVKLRKIYSEPMDIFFAVVKKEWKDWKKGLPNPRDLKWDANETVCKHLVVQKNGKEQVIDIPDTIRVGFIRPSRVNKTTKYNALLIDDMEYFGYSQRLDLSFKDTYCINISSKSLIQKSLAKRSTFGIFIEDEERKKSNDDFTLRIIARATLVPPYLGHVVP